MTNVKMDWQELELRMDGHANSAPYGRDIVCAAMSALSQAMLQTLLDMEAEKRVTVEFDGSSQLGTLRVKSYPVMISIEEVEAVYRTAVTGMRMIAEKYPEYVSIAENRRNEEEM